MTLWQELGIILLLTMLNGVFAGAELAMLSVRKTRLQELAEEGSRPARAALRLRKTPENLLATVQIGITVIGATAAVFGGSRLEAPLAKFLSRFGLGGAAESVAFVLVISLVSYLSLVVGELVPKSLAIRAPERFALAIAPGLRWLSVIVRPIVWFLTVSSNALLRPFHDSTTFSESRLSPDELQQLLEEAAASKVLDENIGEIASRAIDLARLKASALMVPRGKIISIDVAATQSQILSALHARPHARYPVYESEEEKVIGYVLSREIYEAVAKGALNIRQLVRPVSYFPETTRAIEVLRSLQAAKRQLGLLVEEQGGIAGLITIEDIVEDVFGDVLEEHETTHTSVWPDVAEGTLIALGEAPLHEVSRELDVDLVEGTTATTIGGLVSAKLGRMPIKGEKVRVHARVEIEVLEATLRGAVKVRVHSIGDRDSELGVTGV
jgi:putative hemolysin